MFVIEKLKNDLDARERAWERARDKWVAKSDYNYPREYAESHPSPKQKIRSLVKATIIGLSIGLLVVLFVGFIAEVRESKKNAPKEETPAVVDKNCKYFNLNDRVRIQYGDFTGVEGEIIGGCEEHAEYQVKLDEGSTATVSNDGIEGKTEVGGWTIGVNSYKNLAVLEGE